MAGFHRGIHPLVRFSNSYVDMMMISRTHFVSDTPCQAGIRHLSSISEIFPKLESATGRARKRRRRAAMRISRSKNIVPTSLHQSRSAASAEDEILLPYPPGRPWRVLWPDPHGLNKRKLTGRRIPRWRDIKNGWASYKKTWEDGIRGEPSTEKLLERERRHAKEENGISIIDKEEGSSSQVSDIQSNATKNLTVAKETAQDLFHQARDSKDDIRNIASEAMQLATECLKEFMAGYREGRDKEVDKMLNEYFQEEELSDKNVQGNSVKKRKRKKKRAVLR